MADDGTKTDAPDDAKSDDASNKTFTQADLDRIVQERLARVKTAPPADYDDLKQKAARLDEIEAANKTELQKQQERADAAEKAAQAAIDRANQALVRAQVTTAATKAGAVDPDAVLALLDRNAVTIGDDGQVTGADEAVKALLESKPYLVGKATTVAGKPGSADGGPRAGDGPRQLRREDLKGMSPQEITKARREGRIAFGG